MAGKKTMKVKAVGSKAEVYHGSALHTSGYLYKKHLMRTKKGRIVSIKKHNAGKRAIQRLKKLGYVTKKNKFTLFKKMTKKGKKGMKGGSFFEEASGSATGSQ
jgi:hypothetical protein